MMNKIISILNVCIALFVILYAAHVYTITADISLVTVVLLVAGTFSPLYERLRISSTSKISFIDRPFKGVAAFLIVMNAAAPFQISRKYKIVKFKWKPDAREALVSQAFGFLC